MYPSTAKQRLWLVCLGYDAPESTTSEQARRMFDDASASDRRSDPATRSQLRLAESIGVSTSEGESCHDLAGRLYSLLLLRAWVFSVYRNLTGTKSGTYSALGLSDRTALEIARKLFEAGLFEKVDNFATTEGRESDVFYKMTKTAQKSAPFEFVAERLKVASPLQQVGSSKGRGCLGLIVIGFVGAIILGLLI